MQDCVVFWPVNIFNFSKICVHCIIKIYFTKKLIKNYGHFCSVLAVMFRIAGSACLWSNSECCQVDTNQVPLSLEQKSS